MSAMAGTEVKLFASAKERRKFDDLADLYSILVATEHLEKAFGRDAVTAAQYETQCSRLISQFKLSEAALRADGTVGDVGDFMDQYSMDCPRARERLLRHGVPATVLHAESRAGAGAGEALAAETTQHFITAMDALKLEERAVDSVQPLLQALQRVSGQFSEACQNLWTVAVSARSIDFSRSLLRKARDTYREITPPLVD